VPRRGHAHRRARHSLRPARDVTQEILDREREIYKAQARATGKPEPVIEKIVNGKMEKFYEEHCLYEQHFHHLAVHDFSMTGSGFPVARAPALCKSRARGPGFPA